MILNKKINKKIEPFLDHFSVYISRNIMEEMGFSIVGLGHQTKERGRDGEDWNRSFYFYEEEH